MEVDRRLGLAKALHDSQGQEAINHSLREPMTEDSQLLSSVLWRWRMDKTPAAPSS
jgi:hypothetical protein